MTVMTRVVVAFIMASHPGGEDMLGMLENGWVPFPRPAEGVPRPANLYAWVRSGGCTGEFVKYSETRLPSQSAPIPMAEFGADNIDPSWPRTTGLGAEVSMESSGVHAGNQVRSKSILVLELDLPSCSDSPIVPRDFTTSILRSLRFCPSLTI